MNIHVPTALLSAIICGVLGFAIAVAIQPSPSIADGSPPAKAATNQQTKVLKQIRDRLALIYVKDIEIKSEISSTKSAISSTSQTISNVGTYSQTIDKNVSSLCKSLSRDLCWTTN